MEQTPIPPEESLLTFPTQFPIKVMGKNHAQLQDEIVAIFTKHVPDFSTELVSERQSREGNWLALTITIEAQSREQLDAIYRELTAHELVEWVL